MKKALADIGYIQTAGKAIRDLLVLAYVKAFHSINSKWPRGFQTRSIY